MKYTSIRFLAVHPVCSDWSMYTFQARDSPHTSNTRYIRRSILSSPSLCTLAYTITEPNQRVVSYLKKRCSMSSKVSASVSSVSISSSDNWQSDSFFIISHFSIATISALFLLTALISASCTSLSVRHHIIFYFLSESTKHVLLSRFDLTGVSKCALFSSSAWRLKSFVLSSVQEQLIAPIIALLL